MATEFRFKNKQKDPTLRAKYYINLLGLKADFETVMQQIQEHGLPTTREFITKCGNPTDLRKYFNKQLQAELQEYGGELADDADHSRIVAKWRKRFEEATGFVSKACGILKGGTLPTRDTEDGTPKVDTLRLEQLADELATYEIDGKALAEYHAMIVDYYEKRKALKEYEERHNLQGFSQGRPVTYNDVMGAKLVAVSTDLDAYFKDEDSPDRWLKVFGGSFRRTQPTADALNMLM